MLKCHSVKTDIKRETSLKLIVNDRSGFTLTELIVVITILTIITSISVPRFFGLIQSSRIAADQATVATLNKVTPFS